MKQAILDTDTVSYFFRGNKKVIAKVDKYLNKYGFINISVITYYEVLNGLYYKDAKKQLYNFEKFANLNEIIPLTKESSKQSADIMADLKKKGKIIGHNDVLIAGIAIENDFVLITNNSSHFSRIKNLDIDNWS
ncbi:MAG TPA: type II toxin-antitoxin system VapC family toxin [Phaeodactylibacter sp.]|nr:type II toxin-antitoxin system VapC family toxin [Phaeodactylibacter sp.]